MFGESWDGFVSGRGFSRAEKVQKTVGFQPLRDVCCPAQLSIF
jgi:hypothetical protein